MIIDNNFSTVPERAISEGQHSDAELECKRLLTLHAKSRKPDDMTVVALLHSLAQALEGQEKYPEALDTRLLTRDMLITLMNPS
jgi:hypothetical protein